MLKRSLALVAAALVLISALPVGTALAQEVTGSGVQGGGRRGIDVTIFPSTEDPYARIGIGAGVVPDYEGSDDYTARPVPIIDARYAQLLVRGASIRLALLELNYAKNSRSGTRVLMGPLVRYRGGRDEDENDALEGLGDVDASVEAGGFIQGNVGPWGFDVAVAQDVSDSHEGLLAKFGVKYIMPVNSRLMIAAGPSASWASDDYMQTFFAVSDRQAASSGLAPFDAGAGFKDVGIQAQLSYGFLENWMIEAQAGYSRLLGDAADSPIVSDEGSENQARLMLGISYRF